MPILELRILPPLAIGRFGSSPNPLEAYDLELCSDDPLDFRHIRPMETLEIDPATGAVARKYTPDYIRFKDPDGRIRPVAPFLEVFALTAEETLEPLTLNLLAAEGIGPDAVHWTVEVGNLKMFRQTAKKDDKVLASEDRFNDHEIHELRGKCVNFLEGKYIPFGNVRYIRPTDENPQIRLRFTPAAGKVYGSSPMRFDLEKNVPVTDPVFKGHEDRIVYDAKRGTWLGFQADVNSKTLPNPSDIYQGYWPDPNKLPISWGYLDDVCDGPVSVEISLKDGSTLAARAWISACMPAFAPDSEPMRTVADELEQLILGPEIEDEEVSIDQAAEIVRRALETVRLMNTMVMNGNIIDGRANIGSTLVRQDTNDYGRQFAPIMASSIADNLAVRALHERIYAALKSRSAPWFAEVLRRPEEVGDLSDKVRRKMPPMLRGADGRALTLTRRQISKIVKAATYGLREDSKQESR
jgi:hypothetical protein